MATRLLYVASSTRFFLSHRLPVAVAAREEGFEVHLAAPVVDDGDVERVQRHGVHHHSFTMSRSGAQPCEETRTTAELARLCRDVAPTLTHNVGLKAILHGTLAVALTQRSTVVNAVTGLGHMFTEDGGREKLARGVLSAGLRLTFRYPRQRVIVQNADDASLLTHRLRLSPEKVDLIPGSGVDLERFRPRTSPPAGRVVVLASRLLWTKGVAEFVAAARAIRGRRRDVRFVLVGIPDDGNLASVGVSQLEAWHREGVVEWWGWRDDMPDVLARATIVCLPTYREGLPKVLIEAAAAGRPIVATDVPGCREVVIEGRNGRLIPPKDASALATAIEQLLGDDASRERMGGEGRLLAQQKFGIERTVNATLACYRRALGGS